MVIPCSAVEVHGGDDGSCSVLQTSSLRCEQKCAVLVRLQRLDHRSWRSAMHTPCPNQLGPTQGEPTRQANDQNEGAKFVPYAGHRHWLYWVIIVDALRMYSASTSPAGLARRSTTSMSGESTSLTWKLFLGARCALYMLPWLAHLFVADIALSALLPASVFLPTICYNVSSSIAESVWRGVQLIFTRINRANITVSGAEKLPPNESAIVISNHVQWTDFYMIQQLAIQSGMLGRCRWFAKKELKWVPFLGWGLWAMNMPLVSRKWMSDQREIDRVFRGVIERKWPMCE